MIESGLNTLTDLITLRLNFDPTAQYFGDNVNGNPEACFLKVFALNDTFLTVKPGTGIMRTET